MAGTPLKTEQLEALILVLRQQRVLQKSLIQRSGELITELLDNDLQTSDAETTIELNLTQARTMSC